MYKTILLAIVSILLVSSIILQPDESFQASLQGLTVWWNIVFPGLLPFLVLYEIMLAFGLAHALGALLEPSTKRLIKLPGEAALAIVFGWLGGYPSGSEAVASLRKRELIDQAQGQRLLAYAHMPNPLFMLVVIGAGFLHKPFAGIMIAASVWISAIWLLLIASLFQKKPNDVQPAVLDNESGPRLGSIRSASLALQTGREQDGRSFGKVLGDAVTNSVQKLMMIGGFMIFAAVIAKLTEPLLAPLLKLGLPFAGPAIFESHLGAYAAAVWNSAGMDAAFGSAIIAAILAWSGLSGILQTGYAVAGTDLKLMPFVAHRLNHALHAFLLTLLLWHPLSWLFHKLVPHGSFPVILSGQYHASSANVSMPLSTLGIDELPVLWPYSVALIGLLLIVMSIVYLIVGRTRPPRLHH
ncbi:nucleoside recognition domain-containing protein [Paenibacillus sp. GSMTC-2017]|uniref:nucleoside recognition domain-containing protein n=1 Tax=Paenibacillus sp. GSMTC-2017 TaxID=2794350 RepID=UPI0018D6F601|nr:nucleoside recognition domain-containing protein [Paenibacillus sp. GSMTC-2017]MBH5316687.1 nucleoside recognition domain-containing protein [Paenibacillus sp. GSMTC-2017]